MQHFGLPPFDSAVMRKQPHPAPVLRKMGTVEPLRPPCFPDNNAIFVRGCQGSARWREVAKCKGAQSTMPKRQGPCNPQAKPAKRPCFGMTLRSSTTGRSPSSPTADEPGHSEDHLDSCQQQLARAPDCLRLAFRGSSRQLSAAIGTRSRLLAVSSLLFFLPSISNLTCLLIMYCVGRR